MEYHRPNPKSIKTEFMIQDWGGQSGTKAKKKNNHRTNILKSWLSNNIFIDFCNETSIHGFNHIVAAGRHPIEKFCWAAATILAALGAIQLCMQQWQRYVANPTVVSLEKDYRSWNNTFLALTACLEVKTSKALADAYIKKTWNINEGEPKYSYYMDFINVVLNSSLLNLDQFEIYSEDKELEKVDLLQMSLEVAEPYKGVIAWFDRLIQTSFVNVMTELGLCHTINSIVSRNQAVVIPSSTNDTPSFSTVTCQYVTHPCYLRVEVFKMCTTYYTHSPYDIVDTSTNVLGKICPGEDFNTDWKVVETKASDDVKALAMQHRKCRFYTEPNDKRDLVYSGGICRRECRNRLALKLCGCRPFFYPLEHGPLCTPAGLACLSKHKETLRRSSFEIKCNCLPQCLDATYELSSLKESKWSGPFAERSSLKIGIFPPRSRYRRQILFCFEDLVVSFGGAAGLFLGCSFLSGIEIVYFVLERMFKILFKFKKNNKKQKVVPQRVREQDEINFETIWKSKKRPELHNFIQTIAEYD